MVRGSSQEEGEKGAYRKSRQAPFNAVSQTLYVAENGANVAGLLNGATCNGQVTSGCMRRIGDLIRTGGWPSGITLDPQLGTGYNPDNVDGQVSVFGLAG